MTKSTHSQSGSLSDGARPTGPPGPVRWIIAAGGYRSGSTLQYNLIGIYLEELSRGKRLGYFEPDDLDALPECEGIGVVKSHHITPGPMSFKNPEAWVPAVLAGEAIPVSTRRPEADRRASAARKFGIPEAHLDRNRRWVQDQLNEQRWAELGAFSQDYEELVGRPLEALRALVGHLALPWDEAAAAAAVEGSSADAARRTSEGLEPGSWDPISLIHQDHIASASVDAPTPKAQFGEDLILAREFGPGYRGVYVEVGANDGVHNSNTFFFEQSGWTGLLIEPDPATAAECERNRPGSVVVQAAVVAPGHEGTVTFQRSSLSDHSSVALDRRHLRRLRELTGEAAVEEIVVPAATLAEILREHTVGEPDFVTIDVEGHELQVLRGFLGQGWQPRFLIVERNYIWPRPRILALLRRAGYTYVRTTGVNDWFTPRVLDRASTGVRLRRHARFLIKRPLSASLTATKHRIKTTVSGIPGRRG